MKELSIEEKAKAYDEVLAKVANCSTDKYGCIIGVKPFDLFPELAESEDERIRKELIDFLSHTEGQTIPLQKYNAWIAWLEKQGEPKSIDKIAKEVNKDKASAMTFLKKAGIMNENGELAEQYRQDEQIPAWSEEGSPYYDDICEILINLLHSETANVNKDAIQKDLNWFISLKERVQPQNTWKPSDEQMKRLKGTINSLPHQKVLYSLYQDLKKLKG